MPFWNPGRTADSIVIAGNSHISSFGIPARSADDRIQQVPVEGESGFIGLTGRSPRDQDYWQKLIRLARSHPVAVVWAGNQHNTRFMIPPGPPCDFVCSLRPDLPFDPNARLLPERALRALFQPSFDGLVWLIQQIRKASPVVPVIVGTPPPKEDNEAIRTMLSKEAAFVRIAERLGTDLATVRMSSPVLRLKLWCLLQDQMAEVARATGARFCAVPAEVCTEAGFLRPEYWVRDATHANLRYGRIMLGAIARQFS
jgi:hypothetical protein